jgi:glycosyltransferase involved in cell wall biosynthesis
MSAVQLAYIDPYPVPGVSPSTLQILQMADAFAQAGARIDLVTPASGLDPVEVLGRAPQHGLRLVHLPDWRKRWFFPFSSHRPFFFQALNWVRRHRPRAIFVRNLKLAAWLLPRLDGIPLYFETHELFAQSFVENQPPQPGWRARRKLALLTYREQLVYQGSAGVFALTHALADDLVERYALSKPPSVLPDGVDALALVDALQAQKAPSEELRPFRVLYLGSLHPWKGVEVLVKAMRHLPGVELWIAGGEPARIAALQAMAADLGQASIRFLGKVPPAKRFGVIAECDLCTLPLTRTSIGSRYTSPLKLFEYMGMGKAVVASDLPSLREVVRHGENGWLVEPENPEALAAAIRQLQDDPARRAAIGRQAALDAGQLTWESRARRALEIMALSARQELGR